VALIFALLFLRESCEYDSKLMQHDSELICIPAVTYAALSYLIKLAVALIKSDYTFYWIMVKFIAL